MLVLSRKLGQRFEVGDDIRVTIVKIDRNSIRVGIEAPGDVAIRREEIAIADRELEALAQITPVGSNPAETN